MSTPQAEEEDYCRLCAEPTPKTQLITTEDDVAVSSKIVTKMLWINIDISTSNTLPTGICYSCFDLLERTWTFLHNVRTAQKKLNKIFTKIQIVSPNHLNDISKLEIEENVCKPVNEDWDEFQVDKKEVKLENIIDSTDTVTTIDPSVLLNTLNAVKSEKDSGDDNYELSDYNSSDSDLPLHRVPKKRKTRKKKKEYDVEILENDLQNRTEAIPLDVPTLYDMTWDDYMCRCANCDAQCKNIASLRLHAVQIHDYCCIFKCSDCGKVAPNFKSFINHAKIHKKLLRYCCEICNKRFTMPSYVKKHKNKDHRDAYLTMCHACGTTFETVELLKDHIEIYSKGRKRRPRKKEKTEESDLKCEHCQKEFKSKSNLQQHKLVHTDRSRNFSCHVCGKMFFTKGTLSTHMMTHEDTKPFKCEFCPMTFRARGNLHSHASLHSGAKPFVCEQCGKSFRVKRHLKSHSIVHTDLMPYVCEYCNKSFRFKTRLNLHLRQHTGAKPYTCVYCQRDFTNGSNYKKHMKRRHNIDTSKRKYNNIVSNNDSVDNNDDINDGNQT